MIDSVLMMKAIDKNREYVLLNLEKNLKELENIIILFSSDL